MHAATYLRNGDLIYDYEEEVMVSDDENAGDGSVGLMISFMSGLTDVTINLTDRGDIVLKFSDSANKKQSHILGNVS